MKILLKLVSIAGLILTILPSIGVFYEVISQEENKYFMLIGTLLWFGPKIIFKPKLELSRVQLPFQRFYFHLQGYIFLNFNF